MRVIHELAGYKDAVFLTLTYSDDHLPDNGSLVVADLQKFFKRLRKQYAKRKKTVLSCVIMLVASMAIAMVAPIITPLSVVYHYVRRTKIW